MAKTKYMLVWNPQEDITAYELALVRTMELKLKLLEEPKSYHELLQAVPDQLRRHFKIQETVTTSWPFSYKSQVVWTGK